MDGCRNVIENRTKTIDGISHKNKKNAGVVEIRFDSNLQDGVDAMYEAAGRRRARARVFSQRQVSNHEQNDVARRFYHSILSQQRAIDTTAASLNAEDQKG